MGSTELRSLKMQMGLTSRTTPSLTWEMESTSRTKSPLTWEMMSTITQPVGHHQILEWGGNMEDNQKAFLMMCRDKTFVKPFIVFEV